MLMSRKITNQGYQKFRLMSTKTTKLKIVQPVKSNEVLVPDSNTDSSDVESGSGDASEPIVHDDVDRAKILEDLRRRSNYYKKQLHLAINRGIFYLRREFRKIVDNFEDKIISIEQNQGIFIGDLPTPVGFDPLGTMYVPSMEEYTVRLLESRPPSTHLSPACAPPDLNVSSISAEMRLIELSEPKRVDSPSLFNVASTSCSTQHIVYEDEESSENESNEDSVDESEEVEGDEEVEQVAQTKSEVKVPIKGQLSFPGFASCPNPKIIAVKEPASLRELRNFVNSLKHICSTIELPPDAVEKVHSTKFVCNMNSSTLLKGKCRGDCEATRRYNIKWLICSKHYGMAFVCPFCKKRYSLPSSLYRHLKLCASIPF